MNTHCRLKSNHNSLTKVKVWRCIINFQFSIFNSQFSILNSQLISATSSATRLRCNFLILSASVGSASQT